MITLHTKDWDIFILINRDLPFKTMNQGSVYWFHSIDEIDARFTNKESYYL